MSYIIIAEVGLNSEENSGGNIEKVEARIFHKRGNIIYFDVPGDLDNKKEITRKLCNSLINAGFVQFNIRHSF